MVHILTISRFSIIVSYMNNLKLNQAVLSRKIHRGFWPVGLALALFSLWVAIGF
jgi:hypothetical protein